MTPAERDRILRRRAELELEAIARINTHRSGGDRTRYNMEDLQKGVPTEIRVEEADRQPHWLAAIWKAAAVLTLILVWVVGGAVVRDIFDFGE